MNYSEVKYRMLVIPQKSLWKFEHALDLRFVYKFNSNLNPQRQSYLQNFDYKITKNYSSSFGTNEPDTEIASFS